MNVYTSEVKESLTKLILSQNKINTNLEEVHTMFAKKFLLSIPYAQTHLSALTNVTTHCDSLNWAQDKVFKCIQYMKVLNISNVITGEKK